MADFDPAKLGLRPAVCHPYESQRLYSLPCTGEVPLYALARPSLRNEESERR